MNIITVFAGRKSNIEILKKYLTKALELNIIHEVHFWNNTRNSDDEDYLKTISNLKRTSSSLESNYILITPIISNNSFELTVKASNDVSIKLTDLNVEYEIVIGGWGNTKSVIRENNEEICHLFHSIVAENYNTFKIIIDMDILKIINNGELLFSICVKPDFNIKNIYFKTSYNSVGDLTYNTTQNKGFYFMDTCEKSWKNYYNYYNNKKFEDDIIIKSDDDIVFIDLNKLAKYIDFIKNNDYDLVFANIINNGMSAYYQQNIYNIIPKDILELEYPIPTCSLWESGKKAEILHAYFVKNYKKFLDYNYNNEIIPIDCRFSINFFGYKGKNWYKIIDCYEDDEYKLTVEYVDTKNFKNILYSDCYVSHLSFCTQNESGIDLNKLLDYYNRLYYITVENEDHNIVFDN